MFVGEGPHVPVLRKLFTKVVMTIFTSASVTGVIYGDKNCRRIGDFFFSFQNIQSRTINQNQGLGDEG